MMLLTVLVVAAMLLPTIVFAKAEVETGKITIKPPESGSLVLDSKDFSAIKLFDISVQVIDGLARYAYTPVDGLAEFAAGFEDVFGDGTTNGLLIWLSESPSAADLKSFTKAVMDSKLPAIKSASGGGAAKDVEIDNLDYGYYLVVGSGHADGVEVIAHSALVTVPVYKGDIEQKNVEITLKADAPPIAKTVFNNNTNPNDFVKWTDVSIGDEVTFRIESKVPNMFGYDSYTFIVHDKMDPGLSFLLDENDDLKVKVTIGDNDFENFVVVVDMEANTMTLTIEDNVKDKTSDSFLSQIAGKEIVITYQAILNENATIDKIPNVNRARIEYSNNPYWDGNGEKPTGKTPWDEAEVFVFDFDILKFTGSVDEPIPLSGAEFELRMVEDSEKTAIELVKLATSENVDGKMMDVYRVATPEEIILSKSTTTTTIITGELGRVLIRGLDAGDYFLKEIKAPDGFNLRDEAVKISIVRVDKSNNPIVYDEAFDGSTIVLADDVKVPHTVMIENNSGPELPGTGGAGRTIIYACGGTLAVGILIAYAISKRRKEED